MNRSPLSTSIFRVTLVFLLSVALAAAGRAESVTAARLGLADALSKALGTNANIKRAETDYLESLSNAKIANLRTTAELASEANLVNREGSSVVDNLIRSNLSYQSLYGSEASLDVSPLAMGTQRGSVGLSLTRPLIRGKGKLSDTYNRIESAKSSIRVQNRQLYLAKQNTGLRVTKAYLRAVQAREQIKVQESAVEIAQTVATAARRKADVGYSAEIEATRAEIRVAQTQNQLNLQRQAAKGAMLDLMLEIGSGVGDQPELIDGVPEKMPDVPTLEEAVKRAMENRVELAIADEQITNQQRLLAVAKDQLRPSLAAVAGFNSTVNDVGLISRSIFDVGEFAAGLQYKIPLDRRADREQHQIAAREFDVLKQLRQYQQESIAQEVGQAYRSVDSQRASLEIFTANLKVAEQSLSLAKRMEEAGGTNRDVLDAQDALTQTRNSILSANTELYLAILNLKNAMGEQIFETGEQ